jgi:polar amino acid transport system substrate-binding protein
MIFTILFISTSISASPPKVYQFVGADFPKILSTRKDGTLEGRAVEIIDTASKELKFKYTISILPWVRATKMVMNGEADVLIGPYKTIEREKRMKFSTNHFYEDQIILVTNQNTKVPWSGKLEDIREMKIGVVRGWSLGKKFERYKHDLEVTTAESTEKLLQMLKLHRVDIIVVHQRSFKEDVKSELINIESFKVLSPPLSSQKGYFSSSLINGLAPFMEKFNKYIKVSDQN